MRASCVLAAALVALAAYYVYIPLPGAVSDPWKLMLLDATFRGAQQVVRRPDAGSPRPLSPDRRRLGASVYPGEAALQAVAFSAWHGRGIASPPSPVAGVRAPGCAWVQEAHGRASL